MEPINEAEKTTEADLSEEKVCAVSTWVFDRESLGVERSQWLIKEQPVTLYLNGHEVVTLLCAGHHLDELAAGFFFAEGFVKTRADLESLEVNEAEGKVNLRIRSDASLTERLWQKRTVTSGCGKGSIFYYSLDALLSRPVTAPLRVSANQILDRVEERGLVLRVQEHGERESGRRVRGADAPAHLRTVDGHARGARAPRPVDPCC